MPDTPATTNATGRFHLTTLGTLALVGPGSETVLGTHGHHRRRLALLAVLAAAGDRGRSRDQLLALFWPDASQPRARHALDQLLYSLRASIDDSLFASTNPVRLEPTVISSDVAAFHCALERGDVEAAVAVYDGPFLDGFYLEDAADFERWVETERARLAGSHADALEQLAVRADRALDHVAAIRWWRKLLEADPLSSTHAVGLIRALMNAGDASAALQYADRYAALVSKELDASVGPTVTNLIAEARAQTRAGSPATSSFAPASPSRAVLPGASTVVPHGRAPFGHRKQYLTAALVGLTAIAAVAALVSMSRNDGPVTAAPVLAVLPFTNTAGNNDDAAIVVGIRDELAATLARIPRLRVVSGASAAAMAGNTADARRLADSVRLTHVLRGRVQKADGRWSVQLQLTNVHGGSRRWSQTYQTDLKDLFKLQEGVATAVAGTLNLQVDKARPAASRHQRTQNVAAYELYLRGSDPALLRSDSAARTALEYLRQAVSLDSTFAAGWAALAHLYGRVGLALPPRQRGPYIALAEDAARRSVALDDSLAEAHATLGSVRMIPFDFASAQQHFMRALELEPGSGATHELMVTLALWRGRPLEALAHAQRALEIDPLSPTAHSELALALLGNDRCDEALQQLERLAALQPPLLRVAPLTAHCHARQKKWDRAIAVLRPHLGRGRPIILALFSAMLARGGERDEALRVRARLLEQYRLGNAGAYELAVSYAGFGERDKALEYLEKSFDDGSLAGAPGNSTYLLVVVPLFDEWLDDPRYLRVRERLDLQGGR